MVLHRIPKCECCHQEEDAYPLTCINAILVIVREVHIKHRCEAGLLASLFIQGEQTDYRLYVTFKKTLPVHRNAVWPTFCAGYIPASH